MSSIHNTISTIAVKDRVLHVDWADGHKSQFHAIWLRHQCWGEKTGSPVTGVRTIRLHHIPMDISFAQVTLEDGGVRVVWPGDGHVSHYAGSWLRNHCYSDEERARRRARPILWDSSLNANAPTGSLTEAETDPSARLRILEAVRDYGF